MAAPNFLSLSLELRRTIYGYLTPFHCYISECVGLALCCKQVYSEYKTEVCLKMKSIHDRIDKEWPTISAEPLQITGGKTLASMRCMTVLIPLAMYSPTLQSHPSWPDGPMIPACLRPIFFLYLDHLEFGMIVPKLPESLEMFRLLHVGYSSDVWPPSLMAAMRELLVPRKADVSVMQAKNMRIHLGNRIYAFSLEKENAQRALWDSTCMESDYHCSVDGLGAVLLRLKTEAEPWIRPWTYSRR
ncbi:hypothetical protein BDU57DRAFT_526960 [Ampelomyces quisqualis]|uniref:Uncharacterized protein n=1 Tax=Ampelomyces quisqualis TaxID=50730 RepID=A0A6A5QTM8_AMPQU|nr:hypothetical protein BDU57DRAFT_526960 [Ampelomyces quisqualis]